MDPALISGGAGLLGAFLGASAALGGKLIDVRHARKAEQRRQTDELLASFWGATARLWYASIDLIATIQELQAKPSMALLDELKTRRLRETQRIDEARTEAHFLLARMRLLRLGVVAAAEDLLEASVPRVSDSYPREVDLVDMGKVRKAARNAFETKAAELLR